MTAKVVVVTRTPNRGLPGDGRKSRRKRSFSGLQITPALRIWIILAVAAF